MKLNMKHVYIWNAVGVSLISLGLIFKQDLLFLIGCLGEFAQMLPISLAVLGKIIPDEEQNQTEVSKQ